MKPERDTDRRLRAWVAEGVDRAPERFVWAALDEVERLPQQAPWRATVERWTARGRPVLRFAMVTAAAAIAVVVIARVAAPNPPTVGRALTIEDLPGIVLWEDTKPASWRLDNLVSNPHDVLTIPIRSMTVQELENLPEPAGYVGGRYTNFTVTPDGASMSWATLFVDAASAEAALPFFQAELSSAEGWGYGPGQAVDLGDGGVFYRGLTTSFTGPPGTNEPIDSEVYVWRNGNVLLAVGSWFAYDSAELRAVAEAMDARASASAAGT